MNCVPLLSVSTVLCFRMEDIMAEKRQMELQQQEMIDQLTAQNESLTRSFKVSWCVCVCVCVCVHVCMCVCVCVCVCV